MQDEYCMHGCMCVFLTHSAGHRFGRARLREPQFEAMLPGIISGNWNRGGWRGGGGLRLFSQHVIKNIWVEGAWKILIIDQFPASASFWSGNEVFLPQVGKLLTFGHGLF